jgi:acyl-coenzyme A synthetase/AMP-(fatty) acid ligase
MTPWLLPLSRLRADARPAHFVVARDGAARRTWEAFTDEIAALAATLSERPPGHWLLFAEDTYAFAVGLLGIWQAGSVAVVPPNGQPGTIRDLAEGARGLVTDQDPAPSPITAIHPLGARPGRAWTWAAPDRSTPRLHLFTSGTSGARKAIPKSLSHLEEEVEGLEAHWGAMLDGRDAMATVSHHHIYGLLFRLLWPLSAGRAFHARTHLYVEEMLPGLEASGQAYLVTTPAHLKRLKDAPAFEALRSRCRPVFSSGAPLDDATADAVSACLGEAPYEVFGSTETGGVAWRQQTPGPERLVWTAFARVAIDVEAGEERLVVHSPFVSDGPRFVMGDGATLLPASRFLLRPRLDRVVKVAEKRLYLPEMERRLREHQYVADGAVILLDRLPEPRIAAAVVPTADGRLALARDGAQAVGSALAGHLRPYWDPVQLPRFWRYVDRLPEDGQGKVAAHAVAGLFDCGRDGALGAPELLGERWEAGGYERTLRVTSDLACLDGHFPGFPVVPGAVQLAWAVEAARRFLGRPLSIASIEGLKFKALLQPGHVCRVTVEHAAGGDSVRFRVWNDTTLFSVGRIHLAGPAEASR